MTANEAQRLARLKTKKGNDYFSGVHESHNLGVEYVPQIGEICPECGLSIISEAFSRCADCAVSLNKCSYCDKTLK